MWARPFAVAATTVFLCAGAHPAIADTSVTHRDPDDFEIAPDVHSTTKRSFLAEGGRRVRIRVAGELGPDYRLRVRIDSLLGPRADFVLVAVVRDLELVRCAASYHLGPRIDANCGADPFRAWWGVARRELDPDKRIRWRIAAFGGPELTDLTDRAPDSGWYV